MAVLNSTDNMSTVNPTTLTKEMACSKAMEFQSIWHSALLILILIVTFTGNLLVVLAVVFFRRLRSITNYFVVSLAVSDLLVSLLSLPFKIDQTIHNYTWCLSLTACETFIVIDMICSFASIWNLVIISIDRYTAITHPFQYHSLITTKVGYGMISFVWSFSIILSLTSLLNWTYPGKPANISIKTECLNIDPVFYTATAAISFFLPLAIIIVMYSMVFRVALNQARALAALQVDANRRGRRSSINMVREVKAAKTLAIVVGCFIVCWFPFAVLIQINLWNRQVFLGLSKDTLYALNIIFVYVLPPLNSTMNPIIYALFNREFRTAFIKLIQRLTGRRLGAVGFGEQTVTGLESTVPDQKKNGGPSRGIRFENHDSETSENPLPTIAMQDPNSYYNTAYNEQSKSKENNINVDASTRSSKATLDIENKISLGIVDEPSQNGCVGSDERRSPKVDKSIKLPPLERMPSLGTESATPNILKSNTLPPIKPNSLSHTDISENVAPDHIDQLDDDIDDKNDEKNSDNTKPNDEDSSQVEV